MSTDPSRYVLNHTMLRIHNIPNPDAKFDLYFLAYDSPKSLHHGKHWTARQGILELTHNYGTEKDDDFKVANGNSDPGKGFGHICISVDNIQAACTRISDAGYKFQKRLEDGRMRHIAFALDPDGYWVEIIARRPVEQTVDVKETDPSTYKFNHSMIRVKDKDASLKFYQEAMGMQLMRTAENPDAKFNLYFLAYKDAEKETEKMPEGINAIAGREGILELTYNYGTETDPNFKYHNGNDEPQGFGHICIAVDDMEAACKRFEEKGVNWKKRMTDGRMKNIAFVLDPDNYWIEIVQNEAVKKSGSW